MAGILLKNVPEALHNRLRLRARVNLRSIAGEAIMILERALSDGAGPPTLKEIDALRTRGAVPLTEEILEKALDEGRA